MDNLDFLNLNSYRSYPIKDDVSRISSDGLFKIPNNLMVDMIFSADSSPATRYYISSISNMQSSILISISNDSNQLIGTFNIDTVSHVLYKDYFLNASNLFTGANGRLCVALLDDVIRQPTGVFNFSLSTSELETRISIPCIGGVNRIIFTDDTNNQFAVDGNVTITARANLRFSQDNAGIVYLDAGNGLGLNTVPLSSNIPIKTINNIQPDVNGNFTITMLDCDNLNAVTNGLELSDSCNKPCLGCNDIGELTNRLVALDTDLLSLRKYFDDLNLLTQQLNNVINFSCELQ